MSDKEKKKDEPVLGLDELRRQVSELKAFRSELKFADEALRMSEERYRIVADFTYDWEMWQADDGTMLYVSPSCERISGHPPERLMDEGFMRRMIHEQDLGLWDRHVAQMADNDHGTLDFRIRHLQGKVVWISLEAHRVRRPDGESLGVRSSLRDITERHEAEEKLRGEVAERKRAERALKESEERYRTIADFTYDWEMWQADDGTMLYVSPSCERITGFGPDLFMRNGKFMRGIILDADQALWDRHAAEMSGAEHRSADFRIRRRNGAEVWISLEAHRVRRPDGGSLGVRSSLRDVTERRRAQEALREAHEQLEIRVLERTRELKVANEHLRQEIMKGEVIRENLHRSKEEFRRLSMHLQENLEEERTHIAREIHDELGQNLTALNMGLSRLTRFLPEDSVQALEKIGYMKQIIEETIGSVQRISRELRPGLLDDLGLVSAAKWQAGEFEKRTGIRVELSADQVDLPLDRERVTNLYRVFQEALTNAARHSGASLIKVRLHRTGDMAVMEVQDNGSGISKTAMSAAESFGLIGMRERVHSMRGVLEISASPGTGTKVWVGIPLRAGKENGR
ncbi:MAG: PAS domain-containing sensor histidine kinase [Desulfovibrionaceae bacterium]|nr:PAS domain-containing sensor histidine kinase [Desulfovibrionaceae bacterium]